MRMQHWPWFLAVALLVFAVPHAVEAADGLGGSFLPRFKPKADDRFAAVAFSSATKRYGYAYNCATRERAEQLAIEKCGAPDARAVTWCKNAWIAVARGSNNSTGWGWGKTEQEAKNVALEYCLKYSASATVVVCVHARK